MKIKKKSILMVLMIVTVLAVPIILQAVRDHYRQRYIEGLRPPEDVATLADFRESMDSGHEYYTFEREEAVYYEARKRPPDWVMPSGWTCYVFNEQGMLLDWTWDNWSGNAWEDKWGSGNFDRKPVDNDQLETIIEAQQ